MLSSLSTGATHATHGLPHSNLPCAYLRFFVGQISFMSRQLYIRYRPFHTDIPVLGRQGTFSIATLVIQSIATCQWSVIDIVPKVRRDEFCQAHAVLQHRAAITCQTFSGTPQHLLDELVLSIKNRAVSFVRIRPVHNILRVPVLTICTTDTLSITVTYKHIT